MRHHLFCGFVPDLTSTTLDDISTIGFTNKFDPATLLALTSQYDFGFDLALRFPYP